MDRLGADEDLVDRLARGEPEVVADLYRRHGARMVAFARRYVNQPGAAEDVVVGLLGRWLERPPHIGAADKLASFLATSVYHAAIDWIRSDRVEQGQPPRSPALPTPRDGRLAPPLSVPGMGPAELRLRLERALEQLPPGERLLLESHYGLALSAEECMAELGINRAAFHQRLHRARKRLAELIDES